MKDNTASGIEFSNRAVPVYWWKYWYFWYNGMVLHIVVANPLSPKNGSDISYRNDGLYIGLQKKGVQHIK